MIPLTQIQQDIELAEKDDLPNSYDILSRFRNDGSYELTLLDLLELARIDLPEYAKALMEAMESIRYLLERNPHNFHCGCEAHDLLAAYHAQEPE